MTLCREHLGGGGDVLYGHFRVTDHAIERAGLAIVSNPRNVLDSCWQEGVACEQIQAISHSSPTTIDAKQVCRIMPRSRRVQRHYYEGAPRKEEEEEAEPLRYTKGNLCQGRTMGPSSVRNAMRCALYPSAYKVIRTCGSTIL